jgi:hypothetical protein
MARSGPWPSPHTNPERHDNSYRKLPLYAACSDVEADGTVSYPLSLELQLMDSYTCLPRPPTLDLHVYCTVWVWCGSSQRVLCGMADR